MFDYSQHCGHKKTFFTEDKLNYLVKHMEKLDSTMIPEGSCKGIDINHTAVFVIIFKFLYCFILRSYR